MRCHTASAHVFILDLTMGTRRQAAGKGDSRMVRALVRMGAHVDELDHAGRSALHRGVRAGHLGVVGVLLKLGADVNLRARGRNLEAPLHLAARARFSACLRLLVQVRLLSPTAELLPCGPCGLRVLAHVEVEGQQRFYSG